MNRPTKEQYVRIIRRVADTDGLRVADRVNHRALEIGQVPVDWFLAAAQELKKDIIDR